MFLPDVNLWLALTFESHFHHVAAKAWLNASANGPFSFCRMTQQGFLRLATNAKAFAKEAVSLNEAWRLYDSLLTDPRILFKEEPDNVETIWRNHTQSRFFSPKVWNDAYLAAFAEAAGIQLVTFDQGFAEYKSKNCTILS
jgi:toxin-antitoxin system PIN domain toxin